jgi:hypothetical protein
MYAEERVELGPNEVVCVQVQELAKVLASLDELANGPGTQTITPEGMDVHTFTRERQVDFLSVGPPLQCEMDGCGNAATSVEPMITEGMRCTRIAVCEEHTKGGTYKDDAHHPL